MNLNPQTLFPDFPRKNKSMPDLLSVTPKYNKYLRHHPLEEKENYETYMA